MAGLSHQPTAVYPHSQQLRSSTFSTVPMDHFNNFNNTNLHSTSSALDEFDTHPFLGQTSANERAHSQTHTFTEGWAMSGQPGHTLGLPTSLFGKHNCSLLDDWCLTHESPELASSATSHIARTHGYGQQQFPGYHWPMTGPYDQPYGSGIASRDNFFAETVALEASTVVPAPSSGKHLFSDETLRNRVLTDRKQARSTTGEIAGAGRPPARSTR